MLNIEKEAACALKPSPAGLFYEIEHDVDPSIWVVFSNGPCGQMVSLGRYFPRL